ncbi:putative folate-biopterin transporter 8, chloroplastic [Canna indica]|uniref:Folate-biopterin transporter 8, chloroplastic n=1 Tax=Canna indica TaxID=4628 RepID=A0AAQ3KDM3_9LILI|nr:putative folate-biopterin transporter 8, chloroplastic [Canna indica]
MVCLSKAIFTSAIHRTTPSLPYHPPTIFSCDREARRIRAAHCNKKSRVVKHLVNPTLKPSSSLITTEGGSRGGSDELLALCGFGYWVQGFRCFPWLALNFHLVHALSLSPSTLQLIQNIGNLPMVAKPLLGVISDAVYIGDAHRLPYISIGAILQLVSWGTLALIPVTGGETFQALITCILLSNLGASFVEVATDALVAEFSRTRSAGQLQSYAFIALAAGAMLGNLSSGFTLLKTQEPKILFFIFALLLCVQITLSLTTKESSLHLPTTPNHTLICNSLAENLSKQFSDLVTAINEEAIAYPLSWIVASVAIVPILTGSMFCFQTQYLNIDPAIIGLSKVVGQLVVLLATFIYDHYLKRIPMRRLLFGAQILYALALLSDLVLVKQVNVKLGISNEVYVLCLSGLAEAIAQFKILPFTVLFSHLCPSGCEGSLFAFLTSAMCLSSILSGILGVGVATLIGVSSGDYSNLPIGIVVQFIAALVPLGWISYIPLTRNEEMVVAKRSKG